MGTLANQAPRDMSRVRNEDIVQFIEDLTEIVNKTDLSIDQVIRIAEIKERERTNDLYGANGDIHDEQMTGIGELLEQFTSNIGRLANALEDQGS